MSNQNENEVFRVFAKCEFMEVEGIKLRVGYCLVRHATTFEIHRFCTSPKIPHELMYVLFCDIWWSSRAIEKCLLLAGHDLFYDEEP